MITDVYIIRSGTNLYKFLEIDPITGNWDWVPNVDEATIFQTPASTESVIQKLPPSEKAYVYQIPYAIVQPQTRKKKNKKIKIPKRKRSKKKCR